MSLENDITPNEDDTFFNIEIVSNMLKNEEVESAEEIKALSIDELLSSAQVQNDEFECDIEEDNNENSGLPTEVRSGLEYITICDQHNESIKELKIPQFVIKGTANLFEENPTYLLTKEYLSKGFTLSDKDSTISFDEEEIAARKIYFTTQNSETVVKTGKLSAEENAKTLAYLSMLSDAGKISNLKAVIDRELIEFDSVEAKDAKSYTERIVSAVTPEQLKLMCENPISVALKVKKKVKKLLDEYREKQFYIQLEKGIIECKDYYTFPKSIYPNRSISEIEKTLYTKEEGNLNKYEYKIAELLGGLDNIVWWHRNISRIGFSINGFLNHYPDFIACTKSGKIIMIETKGDNGENVENRIKCKLGKKWQALAGGQYRYFMVFEERGKTIEDSMHFSDFISFIKEM